MASDLTVALNRLRALPDGTLTQAEVGYLCDEIEQNRVRAAIYKLHADVLRSFLIDIATLTLQDERARAIADEALRQVVLTAGGDDTDG